MDLLPQEKLTCLHKALKPFHRKYDSLARMLRVPFQSSGAFKVLQGFPVHPTRESLGYAVALLDTNDQEMHQRAIKILQQILSLQDQNPNSKTYGVWPKYLEEKLFKIVQPDPNWCNFLSKDLLQVSLHHRYSLPPNLIAQVDAAILHAAKAIQRRNVPHEYTNIAVMGIYVTLIAAQIYKITNLYKYAATRLRDFYDYTFEQGNFNEYNSPTYTIVTLQTLGHLRRDVIDFEAKRLVENLYGLVWKEISHHFHLSTLQWAGPHSRSYSTLLEADVIALIERSTSEHVNFGVADAHPTLDEHRLLLPCPPDLEPFFLSLNKPRTVSQTLSQKIPAQILTTYLTPTFSLGTINYSDFWHQRRPLIAYWGTPSQPKYLRVRCLHNGVDFAAAQFFSVQSEGNVLAGVSFATNIHPVNPYINWGQIHDLKISTRDLKLRFEFGGFLNVNDFTAELPSFIDLGSPLCFCHSGLYFQILIPYAQLGYTSSKCKIHKGGSCLYVDVVLWSGKAKTFHLSKLNQAAIGFALQIATKKTPAFEVLVNKFDNYLKMSWNNLDLKFRSQSADQSSLNTSMSSNTSN